MPPKEECNSELQQLLSQQENIYDRLQYLYKDLGRFEAIYNRKRTEFLGIINKVEKDLMDKLNALDKQLSAIFARIGELDFRYNQEKAKLNTMAESLSKQIQEVADKVCKIQNSGLGVR